MPLSASRSATRTFLELDEPFRPSARPLVDAEPAHEFAADRFDERVDWDRLEPRGWWYSWGRPLADELLLAVTFAPALVLIVLVTIANAIAFGGLRRAFFVQPRVGRRGRIFKLVKFRTMRESSGTAFESWSGGDVARVTAMGRFLRSTHLDELPQLVNVLRGEMSFIGPRPEMIEVEEWAGANVPGFIERLAIKPGITGWAQITQGYTPKNVAAYERKLALNREYLAKISFATDLGIVVRTVVWMALGRGWRWNKAK